MTTRFVVLNKANLAMTTDVPEEMYEVPIGKAEVVRQGTDFTILAMGRMVVEALAAAKTEVMDYR